ncbi:MAG: nucleotidyl transferase AbiEii/AbiGii toxin family protein [Anaerolineales bacterium]|nr:nucleotidyl transferase AbiEii/AbiGii toxin family protein [Anaerolineales bacterium]
MITDDALRVLATKFQTTELNVRREYFQHLFLSYFYQQPLSDRVLFKGGTALRMLYGSPRFSEDLDFSASISDVHTLEEAILGTLAAIVRENVEVDVVESKTTTGGYLAMVRFQTEHTSVSIQLEISLREGEKRGEAMTIVSDFVPAYTALALARDLLVDEKIQALLFREKARDFYDLYFILRANLLPPHKKNVLPQVLETLRKSRMDFEQELKEFLPRSHWAIIRSFPASLEKEIKRFL